MTRHTTDDGSTGSTTTRRGFVRLGIGAGAAAAGVASGSSPARAQLFTVGTPLANSAGVQYLVGEKIEDLKQHFVNVGSEEDYESVQSDSLYFQARQDAQIIQSENDRTLTQAQNLLANAKSAAYQIGRTKFIESLNEGKTVAKSQSDADTAITEYFVPTQKNVVGRWKAMMAQVEIALDRRSQLGISNDLWVLLGTSDADSTNVRVEFQDKSYTYLDGTTENYRYVEGVDYDGATYLHLSDNQSDSIELGFAGNADYSKIVVTDRHKWWGVLTGLQTKHDEAQSELQAFVDGIRDKYTAGDISTEELVSPRDLWKMSSEDSETPYAAADLAGLGLEVNQDSSVVIKLLNDDEQIEGSVYLSKSPIGEALAAENVYDPTASRSTDADGNPNDSIDDYEATEADPIPLDGLAFIAYNTDDGSTYGQIEQPFRVESVFGEDGEELQSASYEPSTGQQTTTTDIDELRSELQAMNDEIIELEEERREMATGGGGGGGGRSSLGTLAAAAAGGGLLLALLTGSGS